MLTKPDAERVFDLLVAEAGAPEPLRDAFVRYTTENERGEFRFCGSLGFGGKFWFYPDGEWRISCYRENETGERLATIAKVNAALTNLCAYRGGFRS